VAAIALGCTPETPSKTKKETALAKTAVAQAPNPQGQASILRTILTTILTAAPATKEPGDAASSHASSQPPRDELTLIAGGDVCFGREVGQVLLRDPSYNPFAAVAPLFASADVRFVNLESQLSDQKGETQSATHPLVFTGPPAGADALARAGIQVVSTANNHMWDYGRDAFFETLANLERAGVAYAGAGRTQRQTYTPVILEHEGFRIAVLAVTDIWNQGSLARHPARPHIATADHDGLAATVRKVRVEKRADAIIVSYHGGVEYSERPLPEARAFAHRVIDSGADAFIGHHPHVIQGIELRKGKPIFYSLGNFVMNVNPDEPDTQVGMLTRLKFRRDGTASYEVCPVRSRGLGAIPLRDDPAREATIAAFVARIQRSSARFSHAPEIGAFGADGCARLTAQTAQTPSKRTPAPTTKEAKNRSSVSKPGTARQRTGL
jgi:poly-gamma-glutamate synthesis protein (capsule biosynthesis protein)